MKQRHTSAQQLRRSPVRFAKDHLRLQRIQGLTRLELLVKANQGLTAGPLLDSPVAEATIWGCFIPPMSSEIGIGLVWGSQLSHIFQEAWPSAIW